jgi:hypothetical protein
MIDLPMRILVVDDDSPPSMVSDGVLIGRRRGDRRKPVGIGILPSRF